MLRIAIDAGHSMNTPGKRCHALIDPTQTREWFLNDRIADFLEAMLLHYDCVTTRLDDVSGVTDVSLAQRVKCANAWNADIVISIHHNAGIAGKSGGGTVVYYCSSNSQRTVQAAHLYNHVVDRTGLIGNRSAKVIKKSFYILRKTKMPAFLIENGFMDSTTDVPMILTNEHAKRTATGIVDWLITDFDLQPKK